MGTNHSDKGQSAAELNRVYKVLKSETVERRRAEDRVQHLNNLLRIIRDINQLITYA